MNTYTHAPVLISVYNRFQHFSQCINSLVQCRGADQTPLFIAIDAPFRDEDVEANNKIRQFAKEIKGFRSVELFCREKNMGARGNVLDARKQIFSKYDTMIMSEDDNVFSRFFLQFVNTGLNLYKESENVFSISGYNYPIERPIGYEADFYFYKAFSAWGVGYWKEKFNAVDFETKSFWKDFKNPFLWNSFNKTLGDHVFIHLLHSKIKKQVYGDTAVCCHLFKNDMVSVFPSITLVRNLGHDGSGIHCGDTMHSLFSNQAIWEDAEERAPEITYIKNPVCEAAFRKSLQEYFHRPLYKKITRYLEYIILSALRNKST
jgi:hypothetical protein